MFCIIREVHSTYKEMVLRKSGQFEMVHDTIKQPQPYTMYKHALILPPLVIFDYNTTPIHTTNNYKTATGHMNHQTTNKNII